VIQFLVAVLLAAASSPPVSLDEREIIDVTVRYVHVEPINHTLALHDDFSPLADLRNRREPRLFGRIDGDERIRARIADELINALAERNKKSVTLKGRKPHPTHHRQSYAVSIPGISRDGQRALSVMVGEAGGGWILYLEKHDTEWHVVAEVAWEN
jgi:hypothetical protein